MYFTQRKNCLRHSFTDIPSGKEAITGKENNTAVEVMFALELKEGCGGSIECVLVLAVKSVANCSGKSVVIYDAREYGSVF